MVLALHCVRVSQHVSFSTSTFVFYNSSLTSRGKNANITCPPRSCHPSAAPRSHTRQWLWAAREWRTPEVGTPGWSRRNTWPRIWLLVSTTLSVPATMTTIKQRARDRMLHNFMKQCTVC